MYVPKEKLLRWFRLVSKILPSSWKIEFYSNGKNGDFSQTIDLKLDFPLILESNSTYISQKTKKQDKSSIKNGMTLKSIVI